MSKSTMLPKPTVGLEKFNRRSFLGAVGSVLATVSVPAAGYSAAAEQKPDEIRSPGVLDLIEASFFYGRQYFILRSGRAQLILQADHVDLGPAVTYLLFDAETPSQNAKKIGAFNFVSGQGIVSSALRVELGGFTFSSLGHRTETRWVVSDGVPAVEAVWWAGGVRVIERFCALHGLGAFQRSIQLEGADLMGKDSVLLKLSLPAGELHQSGPVLVREGITNRLALFAQGSVPVTVDAINGEMRIGPIAVAPRESVQIQTGLLVQIPAGGAHRDMNAAATQVMPLLSPPTEGKPDRAKGIWATASCLTTQDATVQGIFDKARYGLPGMIAEDGSMDAGIFEYGSQWARDSSNSALGAIHAGYFELGRAVLERVLTTMITDQGATMIAGQFDPVDREELDQMGEILHALKAYSDWTGDDSLLREHRSRILALIQRPLQFRDSTGMMHDRREYWERVLDDAYELAYQTNVIQGLRDAAEMAPALQAQPYAPKWRQESGRILEAMLRHPTRALVDKGALIKRRNLTGEVASMIPSAKQCFPGAPLCTESTHSIEPDASMALPIAFGIVDPASALARNTLDRLETLWNARWSDGGYDRYNTSSEGDQPGSWPFASCFILRAQHDAKLYDRSRRTLEWLNTVPGAGSGCWFEEIPSTRRDFLQSGLIPWTSAEVILFAVRHWLGIQFRGGRTVIRPNLYPGTDAVSADIRFRKGRLHLEIDGSGPIEGASINGVKTRPTAKGELILPSDFTSGEVQIHTKRRE